MLVKSLIPRRGGTPFLCDENKILAVYLCPCHHGVACPRVAIGGDHPHVLRVTENLLNKQWRTDEKR